MRLMSIIRSKSFWLLDNLKGGYVRNAYSTISNIDHRDSNDRYVIDYQNSAWKALRNHAVSETSYYKKYSEEMDLDAFPIVTKNDFKNDQDSFLSSNYRKEKLVQMSTSGSTGTPFVSYQNATKKKWVNAEVIFYSEKVGYRLGENLSYIRTVVKQNKKTGLKQFLQNQTLINCGLLNDEGIESLLKVLQKKSRKGDITLLGYGSTYKLISDYLKRNNIKTIKELSITGGISGSDLLFDDVRTKIEELFGGSRLVSRYSNEENGIIGQDDSINNVFEINEASYIVEIVDDNGKSVPDGVIGHIVVTDLYNYAMPMIRYDTGDMGAIEYIENRGRTKRCIGSFSGRKVDMIYDAKGNPISPHTITNYMWDYTDVKQFQVIQNDKSKYVIKLNVDESFSREDDLINTYKNLFGLTASIDIEYVDEIPVLNSGKRRYIINNYKKA